MSDGAVLDGLLAENRERDLASGAGGNNHVPMVLIALQRLGAAPEILRRYADRYRKSAPPGTSAAPGVEITPDRWTSQLGRFELYPRFVAYFEARSKESGTAALLRESVPALVRGAAGGAYHGLLRLAYAVEHGERAEVAHSLAYWAAVHFPSPGVDPALPAVEPGALLESVIAGCRTLRVDPVGSIQGRMAQVYASPLFAPLLRPVAIDAGRPMAGIASLLTGLFTRTQDFTLLHGVTSAQAMRVILPFAGDPAAAVSAYWHSICAIPMTLQTPRGAPAPAAPADWDDIAARAVASDMTKIGDYEHTVKLAYSCRSEHAAYGGEHLAPLALRELARPTRFA